MSEEKRAVPIGVSVAVVVVLLGGGAGITVSFLDGGGGGDENPCQNCAIQYAEGKTPYIDIRKVVENDSEKTPFLPIKCAEVAVFDKYGKFMAFMKFDQPPGGYKRDGGPYKAEVKPYNGKELDWDDKKWKSVEYATIYFTEPTCKASDTTCKCTETRPRKKLGEDSYKYDAQYVPVYNPGAASKSTRSEVKKDGPNCNYPTAVSKCDS